MLAENIQSPAPAQYYAIDPVTVGEYTIGLERMATLLPDIRALHEEECAVTEACWLAWPVNINYFMYLAAEQQNRLVVFTVRHNEEIVGNLLYFLNEYENVRGALGAGDGGLYITPAHRKGSLALHLMKYAEHCLKQLGVHYITHGDKSPSGGPNLEKFFKHLGYRPIAVEYVKEINPLEAGK
jgi:GNAT superfamily N-acetyltransferase